MSTIFTGVATALVTPMNSDGSVNFKAFAELCDFQINNGISALVACGTTGESSTLTDEEHVAVIRECVKVTNGRVPVIAGTGSNDTRYAIDLSKEAQELGADALLVVTPYYNKASQNGLITHYTAIADSVDIPIILYNVPSRTGTDIKPSTYKALASHKNIVAAKEANGNISSVAQTVSLTEGKLDIYSGNDDQVIPMISLGGKGVISVFSNIAPKIMSDITAKALEGDYAGAVALQNKYLEVMNNMFIDVNPIPVKEAMNIMGFNMGECRLPLCNTSKENVEKIRASLEKVKLI